MIEEFKILKENSSDAPKKIDRRIRFDYIYIDASHHYLQVKRDIEAWWPRVKSGGILAGHDYEGPQQITAGVKKAVDEFRKWKNIKLFFKSKQKEGYSSWFMVKNT